MERIIIVRPFPDLLVIVEKKICYAEYNVEVVSFCVFVCVRVGVPEHPLVTSFTPLTILAVVVTLWKWM